jgi:hypothetical protein
MILISRSLRHGLEMRPREIVSISERLMNFSPDDVHFESATPPPSSSTIKVNGSNPATLTTGGNMTEAVANGPGSPTDWVAIYSASVPDNTPSGWGSATTIYISMVVRRRPPQLA